MFLIEFASPSPDFLSNISLTLYNGNLDELMAKTILIVSTAIIGLLLYFYPSFFCRWHKHRIFIILINVFLGWTFIGYIIAFVWCMRDIKSTREILQLREELIEKHKAKKAKAK